MLIGYMRPHQDDLNCEKQKYKLSQLNCEKFIIEDHSSCKKRIQLTNMISNISANDKIIVIKLFIIADSSRHLVDLLQQIKIKGAYLISLKENIDTSIHLTYDFCDILNYLVEFQSDVISEKTKKGLTDAKNKGITTGRPRKDDKNIRRAIDMYQSKKFTLSQIKVETGISKSTLYRYLENESVFDGY
ncbi:helix-turn-helix domain-containing protein [Alkalibaculum sp. M08DMB]|uniref:Helix-turn-helix domain-containing protein n=1 Tax=Alkalibaculum sporogenes TaxID=2655001 RepID=A0A6A7K9F9_9FIRM|nr:recombinase family protein [Alkalibaculum sporogenes]MPW26080.1 helix-turn-helix domain-containing protein [Alkalibaculum sporogenes]